MERKALWKIEGDTLVEAFPGGFEEWHKLTGEEYVALLREAYARGVRYVKPWGSDPVPIEDEFALCGERLPN